MSHSSTEKQRRESLQPHTAVEESIGQFRERQRSKSLPVIIEQKVAWTLRSISDQFTDGFDPVKTYTWTSHAHSFQYCQSKRRSLPPDVVQRLRKFFEEAEDEDNGTSVDMN